MEVKEALRAVVNESTGQYTDAAKSYAQHGLSQSGEALRVQILYVLNNLSNWRGERARQVKETLRAYSGH